MIIIIVVILVIAVPVAAMVAEETSALSFSSKSFMGMTVKESNKRTSLPKLFHLFEMNKCCTNNAFVCFTTLWSGLLPLVMEKHYSPFLTAPTTCEK